MIYLLLIVHFVSDFLLQRRSVAENKSKNLLALFEHISIIYLCFLPFGWKFSLMNAIYHMAIDGNIWDAYRWLRRDRRKNFEYWKDGLFYWTIGFDQLLHVMTLVFLMEWLL